MLPTEYQKSVFAAWLNSTRVKLQRWIQQEIVKDDPWDQETLDEGLKNDSVNRSMASLSNVLMNARLDANSRKR